MQSRKTPRQTPAKSVTFKGNGGTITTVNIPTRSPKTVQESARLNPLVLLADFDIALGGVVDMGVGSGADNPIALRNFLRSRLFAMIQDYCNR